MSTTKQTLAQRVGETIIEVKDLTKHFPVTKGLIFRKQLGAVQAVSGVNFVLHQGETFGLVGESGCGKSTTAKLVLLLERATAGQIIFRGRNIYSLRGPDLREYRRSVQAVFQDPYSSLNPRMTIGNTVREPLASTSAHLTKSEIKERVKEALTAVGLRHKVSAQYPHELSGGQQQRVALARALATNPDCIILDEPVSALDVSIRAQVMNLLRDIQDKLGVSYLLIAHDLATVKYVSTKIGVMYLGKLVETAGSTELYAHPLHPYTQVLLSNALPSHPDDVREEVILEGEVPNPRNPPAGCCFHPRCPKAMRVCSEIIPQMSEVTAGHAVACHLY